MAEHRQPLFDREHEADDIFRDVLQDIRRRQITPFDRGAITDLIGSMDDAIDQMNHKMTKSTPQRAHAREGGRPSGCGSTIA